MSALVKVDFHGDTLFAERQEDGGVTVAVKPIIERLGLDWSAQLQRIKRDEVLSVSMVIITMETPAGMRETIGLPLNLVPGFLFGISTGSISDPEVKAAVLTYQRECHEVLYRHFFAPAHSDDGETISDDLYATNTKLRMIEAATRICGKAAGKALWDKLGLPPIDTSPQPNRTGALRGVDFVQQYLEERTMDDLSSRVQSSVLYRDFEQWLLRHNGPSMTIKAFALCLSAIGIRKTTSANVYYLGLRLKHVSELMG